MDIKLYIIYIMISKYLSHWLILYFIIWLLGYIFNIKLIVEYINPYYTSIALLVGFIILILHNILIKKYRYEYSFLACKIITHLVPLILSHKLLKDKHKYALTNLIVIVLIYIVYMFYIDRDIYHTYLVYKPPLNWKEYSKICKSKKGHFIPCILI